MRNPTLLGAAVLLLLAASCANPINLKTAEKYYESGLIASQQGNHYHGAVLYSRALGNAKMGGAEDEGMAMVLYAYGRELALLGEFEEAVEKLEESLRVQRGATPRSRSEILRRVSVLGRVYLDTERPAKALPLLQEAVRIVDEPEGITISAADRIDILSDIVKAMEGAGETEGLSTVQAEIESLRAEHGDVKMAYPYDRFTPDAVRLRLSADLSPDQFKPQ